MKTYRTHERPRGLSSHSLLGLCACSSLTFTHISKCAICLTELHLASTSFFFFFYFPTPTPPPPPFLFLFLSPFYFVCLFFPSNFFLLFLFFVFVFLLFLLFFYLFFFFGGGGRGGVVCALFVTLERFLSKGTR